MAKITSEELNELDKQACEDYKLQRLINYIKDDEYVVMWISKNGYYPLSHCIVAEDDELKAYPKETEDYIDLYNINMEDIKIYKKEIKNWS